MLHLACLEEAHAIQVCQHKRNCCTRINKGEKGGITYLTRKCKQITVTSPKTLCLYVGQQIQASQMKSSSHLVYHNRVEYITSECVSREAHDGSRQH